MIIFTIEATNFIKAGEVEKFLKEAGIRYETKMVNGSTSGGRKRGELRKRIQAEDVKDILAYCATHSNETDKVVGDQFGFGKEVVRRVRKGTHPMCKKVN